MLGRLVVFGVGYVVGTRAGRERYEAIRVAATQLAARLDEFSQQRAPIAGRSDRDPETPPRS